MLDLGLLRVVAIRAVDPNRREPIYRRFAYGDLVDLIMLDIRLVRRNQQASIPADVDTIGGERRTSMASWRARPSTAQWKWLGQQVMFMPLRQGLPRLLELDLLPALEGGGIALHVDQGGGYPAARDRIIDQLCIQGLGNVVALAGDIHTSWAQGVTADPNTPAVYSPVAGGGIRLAISNIQRAAGTAAGT